MGDGDHSSRYSILIAGATGAVGRELVVLAVNSPHIHRVVGLSRRTISPQQYPEVFPGIDPQAAHGKLLVVTVEWDNLAKSNSGLAQIELKWNTQANGDIDLSNSSNPIPGDLRHYFSHHDIVVNAMGTTVEEAGGDVGFRQCDYDYVRAFIYGSIRCHAGTLQNIGSAVSSSTSSVTGGVLGGRAGVLGTIVSGAAKVVTSTTAVAAKMAGAIANVTGGGQSGIRHFAQVSYSKADPGSWFLYRKTKGQTDAFLGNHFSSQLVRSKAIYRPGVLNRKEKTRSNEKMLASCCCCCFGGGLDTDILAEAILNNAIKQCNAPPALPDKGQQQHTGGAAPATRSDKTLCAVGLYDEDSIYKLAAAPILMAKIPPQEVLRSLDSTLKSIVQRNGLQGSNAQYPDFSPIQELFESDQYRVVQSPFPLEQTWALLFGPGGQHNTEFHVVRKDQGYSDPGWNMETSGCHGGRKVTQYQARLREGEYSPANESSVFCVQGKDIVAHSSTTLPSAPVVGNTAHMEFLVHLSPADGDGKTTQITTYAQMKIPSATARALAGKKVRQNLDKNLNRSVEILERLLQGKDGGAPMQRPGDRV